LPEKNPDELGSLWLKQGPKGEYMTGEVNGVRVVCWKNDRATPENRQPAWRVMRDKPRQAAPAPASAGPHEDSDIPC